MGFYIDNGLYANFIVNILLIKTLFKKYTRQDLIINNFIKLFKFKSRLVRILYCKKSSNIFAMGFYIDNGFI